MSLQVYLKDMPGDKRIVRDVRAQFMKIKINNTTTTRNILQQIEHAEFIDTNSYKDRFGYKLRIDDMSEGCKAALCVEHLPDSIIDTRECGDNVINTLLTTLNKGAILLHLPQYLAIADTQIDVMCEGHHFSSGDKFSYYIENEYPFTPGTLSGRVL